MKTEKKYTVAGYQTRKQASKRWKESIILADPMVSVGRRPAEREGNPSTAYSQAFLDRSE